MLCAYFSVLEFLPEHREQDIGSELVRWMLAKFGDLYMVDVLRDPDLQPFYTSFGMQPASGMMLRRYENQAGKTAFGAVY